MLTLKLTLLPESAFGTALAGDTLFGHLCWALRWRHGSVALTDLLGGYTTGRPFAVLSDAFPAGLLPRPNLPTGRLGRQADPSLRKTDKLKAWLPANQADLPLIDWSAHALAQDTATRQRTEVATQNTINRLTGTTGTGPFAPRQVERTVHPAGQRLELYAVLDTARLGLDDFRQTLHDIGASGYGRDASTGLGKFSLLDAQAHEWPVQTGAHHVMTLAPCAPEPALLDAADCFYQPLTRFGRHGSLHALGGQPFKRPLLMLRSGAVLALRANPHPSGAVAAAAFHGRGLGGSADPISSAEPATVHQGYAPMLPVSLPAFARAAA
jgi:CRISPR-associated protein Csm4